MKNIANALTFVAVAQEGSFVKASQRLGMSSSAVSKAVARLEQDLGVKLLHRTTRSVSLTPEGEGYFSGMRQLSQELEQLNEEVGAANTRPRGTLSISVPPAWGRVVLVPLLAEFRDRYPEIRLFVSFDSGAVNLAADGFDLVIRSSRLPDSANLVARPFAQVQQRLCAAPAYLERYGTPETIDDLLEHARLGIRNPATGRIRALSLGANAGRSIAADGPLLVDDAEALLGAARAGMGLAQLFDFLVDADIARNDLVEVLARHKPPSTALYVMYLDRRLLSPRIRVFIDFLLECFGDRA